MPERFVMKPDAVAVLLPYLTGNSAKVFDWLCANREFDDDTVSFGLRLIGEEVGITDMRTLSACIAQLIEVGLLAVVRESQMGRGNRAVWKIVFDVDTPLYHKAVKEREERREARMKGKAKGVTITPFKGDEKGGTATPLPTRKGVIVAPKGCNPCAQKVELLHHEPDSFPDSSQNSIPPAADATDAGDGISIPADDVAAPVADAAGRPDTPPATLPPADAPQPARDRPALPAPAAPRKRRRGGSAKSPTPPSGDHAAVVKRFCDGWQALYGSAYPFAGGKDGAHVKAVLTHAGSVAKARSIVDAYLGDRDRYVTNARHPLGLLVSRLPRYVANDAGDDDDDTPIMTAEQMFAIFGHDAGDGVTPMTWDQCVAAYEAELRYRGRTATA